MRASRFASFAVLAVALAACGGGGSTVKVSLQEWAVAPETDSASAGEVTFEATNLGPKDPHELAIVKTDLAADALPTNADGSANEEGEGVELIGEIEEFEPGGTESAAFDLEAGSYVLFCNIVEEEEGEIESHYQMGMRTAFTVE